VVVVVVIVMVIKTSFISSVMGVYCLADDIAAMGLQNHYSNIIINDINLITEMHLQWFIGSSSIIHGGNSQLCLQQE